jgi:hypothetical protein
MTSEEKMPYATRFLRTTVILALYWIVRSEALAVDFDVSNRVEGDGFNFTASQKF